MSDTPQFENLLRLLAEQPVHMVVVGGVAMNLRAADYMTLDLDICFEKTPENIERLCHALAPHTPLIRSAFMDTVNLLAQVTRGEKFTTDMGDLDLLGELPGIGDYKAVLQFASG